MEWNGKERRVPCYVALYENSGLNLQYLPTPCAHEHTRTRTHTHMQIHMGEHCVPMKMASGGPEKEPPYQPCFWIFSLQSYKIINTSVYFFKLFSPRYFVLANLTNQCTSKGFSSHFHWIAKLGMYLRDHRKD